MTMMGSGLCPIVRPIIESYSYTEYN